MSSSKSLKPIEGKNVPSPISSLVAYSSDTGSDSESSTSNSETMSQDNGINLTQSKNSEVCEKSNSSDTKSDSESSASNSETISQDYRINLNHSKNSDVCKKSNLSDTGSDSELSASYSKTVSQDYHINLNQSNTSDVCKNSNSKDYSRFLNSASNNKNHPMNYPNFDLNSLKKESVLKSRENELNESSVVLLTESPRNRDGNVLKNCTTPTSVKKSKMFTKSSSTPWKRSYSMVENDDEETASFPPKTRIQENLKSWESPNQYQYFSRKSLPAKVELQSSSKDTNGRDIFNRRRSYPLSKSPYHSSATKRNFHSFRTDQTPYSPEQNALHQQKRRRFNLPYYDVFGLMSLESEAGFIDSHCHLDFIFQRQYYEGTYSDFQKEHEDTFPKSYRGCLAIFCNPFTFSKKNMWGKFLEENNVWASFGCHPHNAKDYNDSIEKSLYAALEHSKVRALGEIGLDYSNRNNCMKEVQFEVFRRQLRIVLEKKLPVVIHCREAHDDAMRIIKEILPINYTIHLHCFTDTWEWAQKWLNEFPNLCIGITNVVTFPSAETVHEVARNIPLDRLLLETDSPYFVPKRGCQGMRWSHPGLAIHVAAQIAALKSVPIEQVLKSTRNNTKRVYNI